MSTGHADRQESVLTRVGARGCQAGRVNAECVCRSDPVFINEHFSVGPQGDLEVMSWEPSAKATARRAEWHHGEK